MQFSIVALLAAFAASAYAVPTAHLARRCDAASTYSLPWLICVLFTVLIIPV
jgi:hypothetical protein